MADRTVTYRLSADIGAFQAKMAQAGASVKKAADGMTGATKEGKKFREGLDSLGGAAGKVGLVAAAGLGAAVMTAANFDQAMSNVQAATMESAENMSALREAAIAAGAETAFSASEAAAGIENLAKAGVSTSDILSGGLGGALDLAAAGSMEVADAAEIAATAMTQFGLAGDQVPHVADLLAAAAGKAQGEVSDFGMALKQSGLVASQVGVSLEETTGGLAAFASAGLIGSDAGTSFKTMLGALTPNSEKAASTMSDLGISAFDAQGNFIGLAEFAGVLQGSLKNLSDEQRQATLETIFGSDAVRAASVLYEQGERGVRKWTSAVDDQGFAAETAATKLDNLKGDLEELGGSLETALIGTGDGAQAPLRDLVQSVTGVVNAYNEVPSATQNAVAGMLAVTAVTGGALWFGSKVVQGIADTREALSNLGVEAGKTSRLMAGIGKGIQLVAIIETVNILQDAFESLFDLQLDQSGLGRSLEALARGSVEGSIFKSYGDDLEGFTDDLYTAESGLYAFSQAVTGWLPGDTALDKARENLGAIDETLASMVEGGDFETARSAYETLERAALDAGFSASQVADQFDDYHVAVRNAAGGTEEAVGLIGRVDGVLQGLIPPLKKTKDGFKLATEEVYTFKDALKDLEGILDKRDALRNYADSLKDLADTVKESGPGSRDAARAFDEVAANIATAASHMKGADRVRFLASKTVELRTFARELGLAPKMFNPVINQLLDTAAAADKTSGSQRKLITQYHLTPKQVRTAIEQINMGKSQKDIRDLLQKYGLTPKQIKTAIELLGTAAAERAIDHLTRDRSVTVTVNELRGGATTGSGTILKAAGGPVYGPGTATSDSIPARLSNGEYVIKAQAVSTYGRELFDSLNAMRFADGGYVSPSRVAPMVTTGGGRVVERVVERMPDRVTLDAGNGETLTMFVRRQAGGEVASDRAYRETLDRMGVA